MDQTSQRLVGPSFTSSCTTVSSRTLCCLILIDWQNTSWRPHEFRPKDLWFSLSRKWLKGKWQSPIHPLPRVPVQKSFQKKGLASCLPNRYRHWFIKVRLLAAEPINHISHVWWEIIVLSFLLLSGYKTCQLLAIWKFFMILFVASKHKISVKFTQNN